MGTSSKIKNTIKNRRIELGLTMLDVSKAVGVSEATVSRWESGNIKNIKLDKVEKLAKVLKLSPSELMGWDKKEHLIISKELQMPKEVIEVLSYFSTKVNKKTGSSMMDIFNKMVLHPKFKSVMERLTMYSNIDESVWNTIYSLYSNGIKDLENKHNVNIPIDAINSAIKSQKIGEIRKEFEEIINDIINSETETFYKVTKDNDGNIKNEIREENKILYNNISEETEF